MEAYEQATINSNVVPTIFLFSTTCAKALGTSERWNNLLSWNGKYKVKESYDVGLQPLSYAYKVHTAVFSETTTAVIELGGGGDTFSPFHQSLVQGYS